ncbi:molybdopterin molybdotransferase MoeA [Acidaminobacter hydrogenoformans]|uniref:Molybdopterin molybdenumtransferase n=1 Tax=Acidaminobacter hydrogenoformans DSM 2784 TaxID=1120920 RepID=A0A1G5RYT3_9FIRM|nr:gephyrin-like molybdotransferase Glp [Acidaminobacter hydrogenoformans]SCZ79284.1 molybdopterin molybdotransferase [Acidaminobacter hydrogenoformans DSM 2784]
MDLFNVLTLTEITKRLEDTFISSLLPTETLPLNQALGRILADDLTAAEDVPHFSRSVVDGYAVRAKDTFGASESIPGFLSVVGAVEMGHPAAHAVRAGEAVYVPTGGALPEGADAVVMIEYTEPFGAGQIAVHRPSAPLENVMSKGDDITVGETVLRGGTRLRPQELGVLSALGVNSVTVFAPLQVSVLSTGDEIVPIHEKPAAGQIRDINSYTITGLVEAAGGRVRRASLVKDDFDALKAAVAEAITDSDLVLLSGGSSVGEKDYTQRVIQAFEDSEILAHGLAIKPGKPTVVARIGRVSVFGLPGQPASAMMIFKAVVEPLLQKLTGANALPMVSQATTNQEAALSPSLSTRSVLAAASSKIHAAPGRTTFQMVALEMRSGELFAVPVHGKSGMISLMSRADGYIQIEPAQEGILQNQTVQVILF